jgi:hypothetical protein
VDGIADAAGNIDEMQSILVFVILLDIYFCYDADVHLSDLLLFHFQVIS